MPTTLVIRKQKRNTGNTLDEPDPRNTRLGYDMLGKINIVGKVIGAQGAYNSACILYGVWRGKKDATRGIGFLQR